MYCRLSLAGCIHKVIPVQKLQANFLFHPIQRCPLKTSTRFKGVSWIYVNFLCQNEWSNNNNVFNFAASTVPADDLAPVGATSYAGTLMAKFDSCLYREPALKVLLPDSKSSFLLTHWSLGDVAVISKV